MVVNFDMWTLNYIVTMDIDNILSSKNEKSTFVSVYVVNQYILMFLQPLSAINIMA